MSDVPEVEYAVVERESETATSHAGFLVESLSAKRVRVVWSDGTADEVELGARYRKTPLGGPEFLRLVDPDALTTAIDESPEGVVAHLILASGRALTSKDIKAKLTELVGSSDQADAVWKRLQPALVRSSVIRVTTTAPYRYSIARENDLAPLAVSAVEVQLRRAVANAGVATIENEGTPGPTSTESDPAEDLAGPSRVDSDAEPEPQAKSQSDGELASIAEPEFSAIAGSPDTPEHRGAAFLAWLASDSAQELLGDRLSQITTTSSSEDLRSVVRFARRMVKQGWSVGAQPKLGVELLTRLSGDGNQSSGDLRTEVVDQFAKAVRAKQLTARQIAPLARAISDLPWRTKGGRSGLVAAIAVVIGDDISAPQWWSGFGWNEFVEVGDGAVGAVLRTPAVARRVVRPLVQRELGGVSSRDNLGKVVASRAAIEHLTDAEITTLFRRVAARDGGIARVVATLSDADEAERHRIERDDAMRRQDELSSRLATLQSELEERDSRIAQLDERVAGALSEDRGLRASEKRQAQIDALRTLASVGSLVLQSEDESLRTRVDALLAREGLEPIGRMGQTTAFDPAQHEAPGAQAHPGDQVDVVRVGYIWSTAGESFVLMRALVRPVE